MALIEQDLFERREEEQHIIFLARIAHQANAPELAFDGAEAAADFDIEFVEELIAGFGVVHSGGDFDAGDGNHAIFGIGNEKFEAHGFEAGDEGVAIVAMAFPARFESLFENDAEGFAEREDEGNGSGVVIGALLAPVIHGGGEVEIPALDGRLARAKNFLGARVDGDGGHARRGADGFLRAAEADVDARGVNVDGHAAESGDRVHDEEGAELVGNFAHGIEVGDDRGGAFAVRETEKFDFFTFADAADIFRVDGLAVWSFDAMDFRGRAFGDDGHALAEDAVDADDGFVARFKRIEYSGFDAGGAGGGDGKGEAILSLENLAEEDLDVAHHFEEPGVEMADERRGHGAIDAGVHVGRTRSQHDAIWGEEFTHWRCHGHIPR